MKSSSCNFATWTLSLGGTSSYFNTLAFWQHASNTANSFIFDFVVTGTVYDIPTVDLS
jgi:hypothetical protein